MLLNIHKPTGNNLTDEVLWQFRPSYVAGSSWQRKMMTHFGWLDIVTFGNLLVELFDIGETRDKSGGRAMSLLTMEDQFGLRDFRHRRGAITARRRVMMTWWRGRLMRHRMVTVSGYRRQWVMRMTPTARLLHGGRWSVAPAVVVVMIRFTSHVTDRFALLGEQRHRNNVLFNYSY